LDRTHLRRKEEHSCYEILRPGFARLNLPYFASDSEVEFIINAVIAVAKNGWTMLPHYQMNAETGEWHHHTQLVSSLFVFPVILRLYFNLHLQNLFLVIQESKVDW
jgi:hypothetical protein